MVADGLLTRQRYREVPPRVDYELTERSRALAPVVGERARWGYEWTWSGPKKGEAINVGAIFRTAPGLLTLPGRDGVVELVVEGDRGGDRSYVLTLANGSTTISEQAPESPDARVSASIDAWVAALGPEPDTSALDVSGDQSLASAVLDAFGAEATRARAAVVAA
jgi:hypothetical protein